MIEWNEGKSGMNIGCNDNFFVFTLHFLFLSSFHHYQTMNRMDIRTFHSIISRRALGFEGVETSWFLLKFCLIHVDLTVGHVGSIILENFLFESGWKISKNCKVCDICDHS